MSTKLIESEFLKTPVFKTNEGCYYSKMSCVFQNSIVVWNSSIYHRCPFQFIANLEVIRVSDLTFYSKEKNLLFQTESNNSKGITYTCGVFKSYKTVEGMYISLIDRDKYKNLHSA